jgi:hypothetical protein
MTSILIMPLSVQPAVLGNRAHFREMNERAQAWNKAQRSDAVGAADVEIGFLTKPDTLAQELQFWTMEDDDALDEFLFGDLLSGLYANDDIEWTALPSGYAPLVLVLEFERHCQFEGWTTISNKGETGMHEIISAYRELGLADEADALSRVTAAYIALADDDHEDFHEILGAAYRSVPHSTPEIEDRLPLIFGYVRSNPALFAVEA